MGRREGATRIAQTEKHTGMSTGSAAETRRQRGRWERRFRSSSAEKNSFPSTTRQKHTSADTPTDCPAFGNAHPDLFTERAGEMAHRPPPTFHPPRKSCWSDVQRGKHVSAFTTWRGACAHAFPQMSECSRKLLFFFFFLPRAGNGLAQARREAFGVCSFVGDCKTHFGSFGYRAQFK